MKRTFTASLVVVASLLPNLAGCRPRGAAPVAQPFLGPTEPMAQVVQAVNANNGALPTLWASHTFEANLVDRNGKATFVNGDGVLLYKQPRGMLLVGTKPAAGRVFQIGSTDDRYWMQVSPPNEKSRMWWGAYRNLGKPCVDMSSIPVRPDLVLEVLGVSTIDTNFLAPPAPTMRFNNDADAYMFVWNTPLADRWAAQKEIWYDRTEKLPRRVFLFDEDGRVVLRARLSRHQPVELPDTPPEKWPKVARLYELYFPDTRSSMTIELDEVELERRGVPTRKGIAFPADSGAEQVDQLDRDCVD